MFRAATISRILHRRVSWLRAAFFVGLLGWLQFAEPPSAQSPAPVSDLPTPQLMYITRVPPSQWELEGVLPASDFRTLLLRRAANRSQMARFQMGLVNYREGSFDQATAPDLLKLDVTESGLELLGGPEKITLLALYRYQLPLLVRNQRPSPLSLKVATSWKQYELVLPANETRGFSLNIAAPAEAGRHEGEIEFEVDGKRRATSFAIEVRPFGTLRVRLHDNDRRPAAARVYLTGSDGLAHMPLGALQRVLPVTGEYYFYAQEEFAVVLPEGEAIVEAVRGPEYAPVQRRVEIITGRTVTADLDLDHRLRMAQRGWYSSDSHIHANYINNEVIDREQIGLQVSGEGLDIANLLVANSFGAVIHDERFFEGKPRHQSDGSILYWNEEMRNYGLYGHMAFFNLKELVHPLYTGFPGTPFHEDYPPNHEQARRAQEQGGIVTYVHPAGLPSFEGTAFIGMREFPVDVALGSVDALDVISNAIEDATMELWYRSLNSGMRSAISAGTDSFTNTTTGVVPGGGRFYVAVPGEFSYEAWVEAFRGGHTFATNGPMLSFTANGVGPGAELNLTADTENRVTIRADVDSVVPIERLEVVANGQVIASVEAPDSQTTSLSLEETAAVERSSWLAARVWGPGHRLVLNDPRAFAHTSPVYCLVGDQPIRSAEDAAFWVTWIDRLIETVREKGVFDRDETRESVIELFREAQDIYRERAG